MNIDAAISLIKLFEGLRFKPYLCPAGIPTIGYGSTRYPNGSRVKMSDPEITKEQAEEMLLYEVITKCIPQIKRLCPNVDGGLLNALIDFTYNLGGGNLEISTLRKRVIAGDTDGAKEELLKWNKARVKGAMTALKGLTIRRQAECLLF